MAKSKKQPEVATVQAEVAKLEQMVRRMMSDRRVLRTVRKVLLAKKPQVKDALLAAQSIPSGEAGATVLRNLFKFILNTDQY